VLDVGCGRGELVELLGAHGVEASGVDLDADMVADAQARGVNVVLGDAIEHLRSVPAGSLGAIVSLHVIEHLELGALLELLELSASRLRAGGVFVAETPNPASLIVLGNSYVLDPTHVRPLHPSLMVFLCESAGFRDVKLRFFSPAEDYQLPLVDDPDAPPWVASVNTALSKLNETLFGPQEYAVIATVA
jgi:SAM-dependent methyltransferase